MATNKERRDGEGERERRGGRPGRVGEVGREAEKEGDRKRKRQRSYISTYIGIYTFTQSVLLSTGGVSVFQLAPASNDIRVLIFPLTY